MIGETILDFRGEECPTPLIKTSRTLSKLKKGDNVMILTDIEECVRLIRELIELFNVESISVEKKDHYWVIRTTI